MKKYHDQVIRNIYKLVVPNDDGEYNDPDIHAELLTSSALPAHCYVDGFRKISHLEDVTRNEQNTNVLDLRILTSHWLNHLMTRSYKQHQVPLEFYNFIVDKFELLWKTLYDVNIKGTHYLLVETIKELEDKYGYHATRPIIDAYVKEHPHPVHKDGYDYYNQEIEDEEYKQKWAEFFAFRKTVRFGGYWKYLIVLTCLLNQLKAGYKL